MFLILAVAALGVSTLRKASLLCEVVDDFRGGRYKLTYHRWHRGGPRDDVAVLVSVVGSTRFEFSDGPLTDEDETTVLHIPTPGML